MHAAFPISHTGNPLGHIASLAPMLAAAYVQHILGMLLSKCTREEERGRIVYALARQDSYMTSVNSNTVGAKPCYRQRVPVLLGKLVDSKLAGVEQHPALHQHPLHCWH